MPNLNVILQMIISICTLLGMVFIIYKTFRDPDAKAEIEIETIKTSCKLKSERIDENIRMIKENHLKHIEEDIGILKICIVELKGEYKNIHTILDERLPKINK